MENKKPGDLAAHPGLKSSAGEWIASRLPPFRTRERCPRTARSHPTGASRPGKSSCRQNVVAYRFSLTPSLHRRWRTGNKKPGALARSGLRMGAMRATRSSSPSAHL